MNILFAHDLTLKVYKNNYYSLGTINKDIMERYLMGNDKIYIYARQVKAIEEPKQLSNINTENIICIPSNIYHSPTDYFMKHNNLKTEVQKALKGINFCVVRLPSFLGGIVYEEAKKIGIPCMVELVGCPWDSLWYYGGIKAKLFAPIMYYKTKREVKNAKSVLYVTEKFLQKRYPTKGKQIGCSDVSLLDNDENILMKRLHKIDEVKKDKIILGTIGNVDVKYKGQELVLDAIYELKKLGYNIEYQMVGGGQGLKLKEKAKRLKITENVKYLGLKSHEEIFDWLDNLDIYIQSSFQEGLCRAVVEAMSRACPCIVSDVGGNSELINERYIFKKGNVKSLYSKLLLLINSKDNMEESSRQNYSRSLDFEKGKLDAKRKEFYNTIIGE